MSAETERSSEGAVEDGPAPWTERPVLLFDGECTLCNGLVQWVVERDPEGRFRLAALQSKAGRALLERHGLPTEDVETFVLLEGDEYHVRSDAALRLLKGLGFPYSLGYVGVVVPRFVRDRAYDVVADHRYAWFGRREACMVPTPERRERFLE